MLTSLLQAIAATTGFLPSIWTVLAVIVAVVVPTIFFILFKPDEPNAPPRFHFFKDAISGKFNMKANGPCNLIMAGYKKHGEIFRMRVGHKRITMVMGNEAQHVFFSAHDDTLLAAPVYKFTIPVFGKGIVYDAPAGLMTQQTKFLAKGLMASALRAHCTKIIKEAEAYFGAWADEGTVDLYTAFSELTILTASRTLLGKEIRESVHKQFADYYQELSDGMSHLSVVFPYAPTEAHKKRDHARAEIVKIFRRVIRARRAAPATEAKEDDFLQTLIDSQYKDGTPLSEDEISGLLLAALFAGQHTSNITSTWTGFEVLKKKEQFLPRILAEQKDVLDMHNGELSMAALDRMELLHNCMMESLRLHPPLICLVRETQVPIKYKEYTIPKGDMLAVAPCVAMSLPELFENPEVWDPDRFAPPRSEDEKNQWAFIAFGGGRHACAGRKFAFLQIKTIWSVLFRQFDMEMISTFPAPNYSAIVVGPTLPCQVRFKRRPGIQSMAAPIDTPAAAASS